MITKGLTTRDVLAIRVNTGWGCLLRCHLGNLTTYGIRWRVYRSLVFTCCCFFSAELYRFATHLCGRFWRHCSSNHFPTSSSDITNYNTFIRNKLPWTS